MNRCNVLISVTVLALSTAVFAQKPAKQPGFLPANPEDPRVKIRALFDKGTLPSPSDMRSIWLGRCYTGPRAEDVMNEPIARQGAAFAGQNASDVDGPAFSDHSDRTQFKVFTSSDPRGFDNFPARDYRNGIYRPQVEERDGEFQPAPDAFAHASKEGSYVEESQGNPTWIKATGDAHPYRVFDFGADPHFQMQVRRTGNFLVLETRAPYVVHKYHWGLTITSPLLDRGFADLTPEYTGKGIVSREVAIGSYCYFWKNLSTGSHSLSSQDPLDY